jgi:hypothetical protein
MMLLGIAPGPEGFELRTFECRNCGHSFTNAAVKGPDEYGRGRLDCRRTETADVNVVAGALDDRITL